MGGHPIGDELALCYCEHAIASTSSTRYESSGGARLLHPLVQGTLALPAILFVCTHRAIGSSTKHACVTVPMTFFFFFPFFHYCLAVSLIMSARSLRGADLAHHVARFSLEDFLQLAVVCFAFAIY